MNKLFCASLVFFTVAACGTQTSSDSSEVHSNSKPRGKAAGKGNNLPAIALENLPVVQVASGKTSIRLLTRKELDLTKKYLKALDEQAKLEGLVDSPFKGDCANNSGYWAGIYGPNVSGRPYDNDLYMVPPGYRTPDGWDCDGFYIPGDVTVYMTTLTGPSEIHPGPGAVKIRDFQWGVLESISRLERRVDATLLAWIAPGSGVNWFIPNFPQQDLDDLGSTWTPRPPAGR